MIATMTANMGLQPLLFDEYSGLAMVLPPFDVIQALTSFVIWVLSRSGFDKTSVRLLIDQVSNQRAQRSLRSILSLLGLYSDSDRGSCTF